VIREEIRGTSSLALAGLVVLGRAVSWEDSSGLARRAVLPRAAGVQALGGACMISVGRGGGISRAY
jgi:hypothetical protein